MKLDIDFHRIDLPVELMQICGVSVACVYAVLRAASENEIANISRNEISNRTGLKITAIKDALKKLEALGIVERHYNPGYATSYLVKDILPTEHPEPEKVRAAEPARQSEQQLKPDYQYYGEYKMIPLKPEEYKKLGAKFGKKRTDKYIEKMENWMLKRNSNRFDDYFGALSDWMMTDAQRVEQSQKGRQKYRPKLEGEQDPNWADEYTERQEEIDKYIDLIN